jgi:protein-tyrosine-phosphatase
MLDITLAERADIIVTMGCSVEELCPAPILTKVVDWKLEDPKGKPIEKVRQIRDEIEQKVIELLERVTT